MAITVVDTIEASAIDGGNVSVNLTTIAGLAQDDYVVVFGAVSRLAAGGTTSSGWTQLETLDNTIVRGTVWGKLMGSTPDTSFDFTGTGNVVDVSVVHARAYRGVDTSTPIDATTTKTSGNSTNPDAPSITTVTNGARVIAFAASNNNDSSITAPSGYGQAEASNVVDTRPITMGGAEINKATAGAEDPPSWTTWITANWVAFTVALRPASGAAPAVFEGSAGITFTPTGDFTAGSDFAGSSAIAFSPVAAFAAGSDYAGTGTITFSATGDLVAGTADAHFAGTASISFSATAAFAAGADLVGATTVTFSATGDFSSGGVTTGSNRGDDVSRKHRGVRPIVSVRPKAERDLDDALEIIETIAPEKRVKENKTAAKVALAAIREVEIPISFAEPIAKIETALKQLSRKTAKHEGMQQAAMEIAGELEAVIAQVEYRRKRDEKDFEALKWLLN